MSRFLTGALLLWAAAAPVQASEWDGRIIEARSGRTVSVSELAEHLQAADRLVIGEKHNTPVVQEAEARILELFATPEHWALAWEFLNFSTQSETAEAFARFARGEIDGNELLRLTQGGLGNQAYLPVLDAARRLGAGLLGVNLTRQEKAPVVRGGIAAADPRLVPPGFEFGSEGYHHRFVEIMSGGHATPEQIENYYAAQCLTDDVMALHLADELGAPRGALVAGSFHTDYFDGVVRRLSVRRPGSRVVLVKVADASDYTVEEIRQLSVSPEYGPIADYLYFVNEPTSARPEALERLGR